MSDMMMMQSVSPEDVVEARLVVELGTVTLACARATKDDLAELRKLAEHAQAELDAGTYVRELSWDFHSLVARAAHNGAVEGITASFRSTLSMHPIRTREGTRSHARTVEEHARILEAIEQRDGDTARRAMAHHLMRGTNLEKRESALLALWDAAGSRQRSSRRAK
jgi:DNA-binding FadR family transcriptional regulator